MWQRIGILETELDFLKTLRWLRLASVLVRLSISVFWWAAALNLNGLYTESEFEEQLADIESLSQETVWWDSFQHWMLKLVHREGLAFLEVGLCSKSHPICLSKIGVELSLISYVHNDADNRTVLLPTLPKASAALGSLVHLSCILGSWIRSGLTLESVGCCKLC